MHVNDLSVVKLLVLNVRRDVAQCTYCSYFTSYILFSLLQTMNCFYILHIIKPDLVNVFKNVLVLHNTLDLSQ